MFVWFNLIYGFYFGDVYDNEVMFDGIDVIFGWI